MKILFLGNLNSVFLSEFAKRLQSHDYTIHAFDPISFRFTDFNLKVTRQFSKPPGILNRIPKIGYAIKILLLRRRLNQYRNYDICHIHYNLKIYSYLVKTIQNISSFLVVTVYGSDFYKRSHRDKQIQEKIYQAADRITCSNERTVEDFLDYYQKGLSQKTSIRRYGLRVLDLLDELKSESKNDSKKILNIPINPIIVTCGTNSYRYQNHEKMIEMMRTVYSKYGKDVLFIFPLTYGEEKQKKEIGHLLENEDFPVRFFTKHMSFKDVARLRRVSDILINILETDQMSGAMLEHLHAGSIVITGSWLPYDILYEKGAFLCKIDSVQALDQKVMDVIANMDEYKDRIKINMSIVNEIARWDKNLKGWLELYNESEFL